MHISSRRVLFWKTLLFRIKWILIPGIIEERKNNILRVSKIIDGEYYYKDYK